uniref:Lipase domain-containing protein n=1 Tax=Anopheles atroparvus TaxID=41427 RepID=A0AAG5DUT5_ANOAO
MMAKRTSNSIQHLCKYWSLQKYVFTALLLLPLSVRSVPVSVRKGRSSFTIGNCVWVVDRPCPDSEIRFYLFTRSNPDDRQYIHIDESWEASNISSSYFNPAHPVKVIIHGYNADMFLTPLINMKGEYLQRANYNLIYVDWSELAHGPCYPSAVHNTRHVGKCIGQLVQRIIDAGTDNIHLVGFSLGAQVTNYASTTVRPFRLKRITGLDPAMPLFITAAADDKLDPSDAEFVDVIHTNALVQGKIERCGHVDFYVNGGIMQPGCWSSGQNPMACSHHRAPDYYAESIRSLTGFWGWSCQSYIYYLLGFCPQNNLQVVAGEDCQPGTEGMFLITTNPAAPFAIGRWSGFSIPQKKDSVLHKHGLNRDPFISDIDQWGKLDGSFNNADQFPTPYSQDPNPADDDEWPYFNHVGTKQLTKVHIKKILEQDRSRFNGDDRLPVASTLATVSSPTQQSPYDHEVDEAFHLQDLRRRLQQKEASVMQHYAMPMYNAH